MSIALDQLLGSSTGGAITTPAPAAAATRIFFVATGFGTTLGLTSVSGGGLTWVVDKSGVGDANNQNVCVASAYAPAGLSSATVITPTPSGATFTNACAFSFSGVAAGSSGYLSGVIPTPTSVFTVAPWATPSLTTVDSEALLIGAVGADDTTIDNSVPTSGTELFDINDGTTQMLTVVYRIVSPAGAYTTAGNWNVATDEQRRLSIAYKGISVPQAFTPVRMPLGV